MLVNPMGAFLYLVKLVADTFMGSLIGGVSREIAPFLVINFFSALWGGSRDLTVMICVIV